MDTVNPRKPCLPFEAKKPRKSTVEALDEIESGKGKRFKTIDALLHDLNESH